MRLLGFRGACSARAAPRDGVRELDACGKVLGVLIERGDGREGWGGEEGRKGRERGRKLRTYVRRHARTAECVEVGRVAEGFCAWQGPGHV